ncbi:MAG: DPP IV N-terminal domain-containing protein [Phycisphaerales bacterium]|nr:DPP IV N-terminal domain-containing protein [Phycisphaerales bacterium]
MPYAHKAIMLAFSSLLIAGCSQMSAKTATYGPTASVTPATRSISSSRPDNTDLLVEEQAVPITHMNNGDHGRAPQLIGLYGEPATPASGPSTLEDGNRHLTQVSFASEGGCFDPDIDRTGAWIAFASTQHSHASDIYLKQVGGKTMTQLTADPAVDRMPCFTPNGKALAFASNRSGNFDIYIKPVAGGAPIQVTSDGEDEYHPSFSPSGTHLSYCKINTQNQRSEIWIVEVKNPSVRHFVQYGVLPEWNPDPASQMLLFQKARQRGSRFYSIWTVEFAQGEARNPTEIVSASNAAVINPGWSPDGQQIVFATVVDPTDSASSLPEQMDIWTINRDGTERRGLTSGPHANYQPAWATDGRIYFVSNRSGNQNIWSVIGDERFDSLAQTNQPYSTVQGTSPAPGLDP